MRILSNEIDRLEIVVEAEAKSANRSLSRLEKHIGNIVDKLEEIMQLSGSMSKIGDVDLSGFESISKDMDNILGKGKKIGRQNISPRINRADLKYTSKSLDDIYEKYKKVGTNTDISDMGLDELQRKANSTKVALDRLLKRLEKKKTLEGGERFGKSWESLIYDIQCATNELKVYESAISKIKGKVPDFTISRNEPNVSYDVKNPESKWVSQENMGYNQEVLESILGKPIQEARTFEAQIKQLKAELKSLEAEGFSQYDHEYDEIARELAEVVIAQKKYNKEMKKSAQATLNLKKSGKEAKKLSQRFNELYNKISKVQKFFSKASKFIGKFSKALGIASKTSKGFSLPKMVGMSVLFSSVFQIIQAIKQAIVEGSNNLVQYSKQYNQSISSIMSSLTYLKNAWAAAFAPIVNAVAPYLSSFINMIAQALNVVGQFLAAITGKGFAVQAKQITQNYASSLDGVGSSADSANDSAKDLQRTLLGFDQMNVLNDASSSSGSGGGGGGGSDLSPYDMFETVEVSNSIANMAQMIKDAWNEADFTEIGQIVGDKLNSALESIQWDKIKATAQKIAKSTATFLNGFIEETDWNLVGKTIAEGLNTAIEFAYTFVKEFNWESFGKAISDSLSGVFQNLDWAKAGRTLSDSFIGVLNSLSTALDEADWESLGKGIGDFITNIDWFGVFVGLEKVISDAVIGALELGAGFAKSIIDGIEDIDWGNVMNNALELANKAWEHLQAIATIKVELIKYGWNKLSEFVGSKVQVAIELTKKGWSKLSSFVGNKVNVGISLVKKGWSKLSSFVGTAVSVGVKLAKKGWTKIKEWLGITKDFVLKFKLPKIKVNWGEKTVGNFTIKYPTGFKTYAKGGFPNTGEMFIANEAGPEIVGRIGNRNAVANAEQITTAIAKSVGPAVYNGVLAAMMRSNGNKAQQILVTLEANAKGIFRVVKAEAQNYANATGLSPFPV